MSFRPRPQAAWRNLLSSKSLLERYQEHRFVRHVILGFETPGNRASGSISVENGRQPRARSESKDPLIIIVRDSSTPLRSARNDTMNQNAMGKPKRTRCHPERRRKPKLKELLSSRSLLERNQEHQSLKMSFRPRPQAAWRNLLTRM